MSAAVYQNGFDESFAAPELRCSRHEDRGKPSVDVFSLGAMLAYCTMGDDQYRTHISSGIISPATGHSSLDKIISIATAFRGAKRYQTAAELITALRGISLLSG